MKILIISDLFYPTNEIGALRPTKIAKKLSESGYQVDVYTRYKCDFSYCSTLYGFEELPNPCINTVINKKSNGRIKNKGLMYQLKRSYRASRSLKRSRGMLLNFKNWLKDKKNNEYDVVFSTFGPLSSLWCGLYYKKKNPSVKWICDFRDPIKDENTPLIYSSCFRRMEKNACKKADAIVAVSNGYLKRITNGKFKDKAYMIPNGYDESDFSLNIEPANDKLTIAYVGTLYEGLRDLSPIFRAIKELVNENVIDKEKIVFKYAGNDTATITQQANKYDMEQIIKSVGKIPRKECLELQFSSNILVLSTWNNKGEEGVFPGKFLEYMLIKKPIISIVDGNIGNSEVTNVMKEGNLGVTYESVNGEKDFKILKEYIKNQYFNFINKNQLDFSPNQEVLNRYNYKMIIKQIEGLIN